MGTRRGFGVILHRKGGVFQALNALHGFVIQAAVGHLNRRRQGLGIYRKTVVLGGNFHRFVGQLQYRVVSAVVTKLKLVSLGAQRPR